MEIYKLLDRFELLYEDTTPDISNLRRAIIDNDLPSLFQILKKFQIIHLTTIHYICMEGLVWEKRIF